MLNRFLTITQALNYQGELQEEESFYPHYVGIFYKAGARCAALGAWPEALSWCRKAFLGKPLIRPALALPNSPAEGRHSDNATCDPILENALNLFLAHAAAGRYVQAEAHLRPLIAFQAERRNAPATSALLASLALLFERAGQAAKAAQTMSLALQANPCNPLAVHGQVLHHLQENKINQALFSACRLLAPFLSPLDIEKAFPGLGLLGLIAAAHPEKLKNLAERVPSMLERARKDLSDNAALLASPKHGKMTLRASGSGPNIPTASS